jgi:hypothetical protein
VAFLCAPALADEPPGGSSTLSFPQWWSLPGDVGWRPEAVLAGGPAWTFAGFTVGGWELQDPFAPATLPVPGVAEAQAPLAWYDSATVSIGEGAAWSGFGAGLAVARGILSTPDPERPRAVFTAVSGEHGLDRNGIVLAHGGSDFWLRAGVVSGKRGTVGELSAEGDHLWTAAAGRRLGWHTFELRFAQRGMGELETLRDQLGETVGGMGEGARGRAGTIGWGWSTHGDSIAARYSRGFDARDMNVADVELDPLAIQRIASQRTYELTARRARAEKSWSVRLAHDVADVGQWTAFFDAPPEQVRWRTETTWLATSHERPFGEGRLTATLGYGHDPTMQNVRDRDVLAPALEWHAEQGRRSVRAFFERVVDPVWSDIAPSVPAFLQHTWTGGFGAEAGRGTANRASFDLVAGRTASRATMFRYPIRATALRVGIGEDDRRYDFLMTQTSLAARWRALSFDARGFALAGGRTSAQPRVDPALGGAAGAGGAFRLFSGDLGVRLHARAAYVGARETDTRIGSEAVLPGYGTYSASATLTLGDATIVLIGDNLENVRHELPWLVYPALTLARDGGRQIRAEMTWPLFN